MPYHMKVNVFEGSSYVAWFSGKYVSYDIKFRVAITTSPIILCPNVVAGPVLLIITEIFTLDTQRFYTKNKYLMIREIFFQKFK